MENTLSDAALDQNLRQLLYGRRASDIDAFSFCLELVLHSDLVERTVLQPTVT